MKRMYGDQRHIAVLQAEINSNDFFNDENDLYRRPNEKDENTPRLLQEDPKLGEILNAKFVYSEQAFKGKVNVPHFRPTTTTTTQKTEATNGTLENTVSTLTTTETIPTTESTITTDTTTEYLTSTERVTEEMTTEPAEKKETGEVLFQDMEEPLSKKNPNQINFKLKGV